MKKEIKVILEIIIVLLILIGLFYLLKVPRKTVTTSPQNTGVEKRPIVEASLVVDKKQDKYYSIDLSYPSSSSTPEIQSYIDKVKSDFLDSVPKTDADAQFQGLGGDRVYTLTSTAKVTHSSSTISYVLETYEFTGGAHGNTDVATFTYDENNKLLKLNDVLSSSDFLQKLSASSRSYFYNKFPDQDKTEIDAGTEPKIENFSTWYIDGPKIIFVFGQYSIGPYVLGIQEFPMNL